MRWLLVKDLQILRRSPLLVGLLVVYPIAIALMIGFALSSPPGRPKVAVYNGIAPGKGKVSVGGQQIDIARYEDELFQSIQPLQAGSPQQAIAKVRNGQALAALIVPGNIIDEIQGLVTQGTGNPTIELVLNSKDPIDRQYVNQALSTRINQLEQAISKQVLQLSVSDLDKVLGGGRIRLLGETVPLLGLRNSRTIVQGAIAALPPGSSVRMELGQVVNFANLAIAGLGFAGPQLNSIRTPLAVDQTELAGKTTPTDAYAVAIAVIVSLMFVALLLAAGMLALERSEHAYARLVRGLVSAARLVSEKVVLAASCAALVTLVMAAVISPFVHVDWGRFELWVAALALGGLAFAALGVAIGGLAREVSAASLIAFVLSLPIAFVALIPAEAVSGTVKTVLDVIAFAFPFKAALEAANNAFSGTSPAIGLPLLHLAVLALLFTALARLALRRFSAV